MSFRVNIDWINNVLYSSISRHTHYKKIIHLNKFYVTNLHVKSKLHNFFILNDTKILLSAIFQSFFRLRIKSFIFLW